MAKALAAARNDGRSDFFNSLKVTRPLGRLAGKRMVKKEAAA